MKDNWNGDMICAIDIETLGLDCEQHDIVEIAIVPLDLNFNISKNFNPFNLMIKPVRLENVDWAHLPSYISKSDVMRYITYGTEQIKAEDMLEEWVGRLGLKPGKRIVPLGHNYDFDRSFIEKWLGKDLYQDWFHYIYRDTMRVALTLNDMALFHHGEYPFPKVGLQYMKSLCGVPTEGRAHSAIQDAIDTAKVYKRILFMQNTFLGIQQPQPDQTESNQTSEPSSPQTP